MTRKDVTYFIIGWIMVFAIINKTYSQETKTSEPPTTKTDKKAFPQPVGYINDFEGILSDEQEKELTDLIKKHEQQTTDQIVIVTLTTLKPYENIEAYSLDLANEWGVGHKNKNNGVLIALGIGLRKIRIQNGYGIEKRLTDTETKKIIDEIITPAFRAGNYYEGLSKGLKAIIEELK